jgi:hypothetical protein
MNANAAGAMSAQDFDALAAALDTIATFAPGGGGQADGGGGYPNWTLISKDGAAAARAQSLDAVRAACRGCHRLYKDKYKREMRSREI